MRINKFIANHSKYSRRKADQLINEGKVFLNGKKVPEPGIQIEPNTDQIEINEEKISNEREKLYLMLNKPAGYLTTRKDERSRPTVMQFIPKNKNLKPVGRLDKDTEGLLVFSNDGEFINQLTHPKFHLEKEYFVIIEGILENKEKTKLEKGIILENKKTLPAKIELISDQNSPNETRLKIIICEGRKRQIRKMFAYFQHPVKYLRRVRIGKLKLANLALGQYRFIQKNEI